MRTIYFLFLLVLFTSCNTKQKINYTVPQPEDVVIYQVNPRVFAPENSFQAVISRLDAIQDLGCNVLWFMPVYPIGEEKSKNSPYSVKDYYGINTEFGTKEDFKQLVTEAHSRNMGVLLDWVPNHTAWDNEWIKNKDWYTQDSLGNIIYPEGTNWTDVADLNFDNMEMRLTMIDAMKYWVTEIGVDGFRCDAVDYVPFDFLKQCNDSLRAIPGKKLLMLAEGSRKDHFDAGFDLNYAWDFAVQMRKVYQEKEPAHSLFTANNEEYANLPEGKLKLRFTTNHDEAAKHSPVVEWVSERGAMAAFSIITFLPGCPMVYGSQETGYPERINFFHYNNIDWSANPGLREEYRNILAIHNNHDGLRSGKLNTYPDDDILLFERYTGTEKFLIAVNTRDTIQNMPLPENLSGERYINLSTERNITLGEVLELQPFEYLILK
ncbi:MAG: alpha-amylase [Tannerella sp.]|jgi:glycosidase|nr:alpha-amylase [Tannerella sp.]